MRERLRLWIREVWHRKTWFLLLAFYKVAEDRILAFVNGRLDDVLGKPGALDGIVSAIPLLTWLTIPIVVVVILLMAYRDTRTRSVGMADERRKERFTNLIGEGSFLLDRIRGGQELYRDHAQEWMKKVDAFLGEHFPFALAKLQHPDALLPFAKSEGYPDWVFPLATDLDRRLVLLREAENVRYGHQVSAGSQ